MKKYKELEKQVLAELRDGFESELLGVASEVVNIWKGVKTESSKVYFDIQGQIVKEHLDIIQEQRHELMKEVSDFLVRVEAKAIQLRRLEELLKPIYEQHENNIRDIFEHEKEAKKRQDRNENEHEKMPLCGHTKTSTN